MSSTAINKEEIELDYNLGTNATEGQIKCREQMIELFQTRPMPDEHLFSNFGLYMRSSALAKILFMNELYQHILDIPGVIVEFGTWWGQNLVLAENLRAIYEPFSQTRRIIGFDTFSGYEGFSQEVDSMESSVIKKGGYTTSENYYEYLNTLMWLHERNNVLGNTWRYTLIKGNVIETAPKFFNENPGIAVALAYFDLALYEPTKICLESILPQLIPGSVIMFDQFNSPEAPGETIAFKEIFENLVWKYSVKKSKYLPDRTLVFIK